MLIEEEDESDLEQLVNGEADEDRDLLLAVPFVVAFIVAAFVFVAVVVIFSLYSSTELARFSKLLLLLLLPRRSIVVDDVDSSDNLIHLIRFI